ncbi:GGDEF domain-containing protein [Psychrosphaera sp. 1_MG-2023]|uniref:GGDEF domain-containing protein n=1 Tax=Psychrosphaera sp. 1_MG-2023 TaxID=3062643 RepID=UPI0026E1B80C|nr:GGDEF domain-containing protein [Psychrosphaera sp. 1_MG-2023]MDO6719359.1 GGDEF domain-containing protein [Psychrosphaera sp. 1_MG-2023]
MSAFTLLIVSSVAYSQNSPFVDDDKVVVVGSIDALEIEQMPAKFADFSAMISYIDSQQDERPKRVLQSIIRFLKESSSLSPEQKKVLLTHKAQLQKHLAMPHKAIATMAEIHQLEPNLDNTEKQQYASELAELYQQVGNYYHAIEYTQAAFNFAISNQNVRDAVMFGQRLASYFLFLNDLDQAQSWVAKAENLAVKQGNNITKIVFYLEKARWHKENREYFLAEVAAKSAINIASHLSLPNIAREASLLLVDVLLIERKFSTVEPLLQSLFDQAHAIRDRAAQFEVVIAIVELQLKQKKIEEAQHFWTMAKQLQRFAYSMPNAQKLNNQLIGQRVQILMAQEKWQQAQSEIVQIPYQNNVQWYARYMSILFNVNDNIDITAELAAYVELSIEQASQAKLQKIAYESKLLAISKENLQQQLALIQVNADNTINKLRRLIDAKSNLVTALFVILIVCLITIYIRHFKPTNLLIADSLTGLPTINGLPDITEPLLLQQTPFSFLLFDLDNFSQLNESQGLSGGDQVLQQMVAALTLLLPPNCILGRLQGDTFYVVATDFDRQQAKILADRIRLQLHKCDASIQSNKLGLTACVVVAESCEFSDISQMITATKTHLKQIQATAVDKTVVFESNC